MQVFDAKPPTDLAPYIDRYWGWRTSGGETISLTALMPGTGAELHIHGRCGFAHTTGENLPQAYLLCLRNHSVRLATAVNVDVVAVRFRIGQIHRLLNLPPSELIDQTLSIEWCWGTRGAELAHRIQSTTDWSLRCHWLTEFFRRCVQLGHGDRLIISAMNALYAKSSGISIDELAAEHAISRRQLERRWRLYTGQTPAETRGSIRFQKTVRRLLLTGESDATAVALDHGYYDQPHWAHDFQRRTGATPAAFFSQARGMTHFYKTSRA